MLHDRACQHIALNNGESRTHTLNAHVHPGSGMLALRPDDSYDRNRQLPNNWSLPDGPHACYVLTAGHASGGGVLPPRKHPDQPGQARRGGVHVWRAECPQDAAQPVAEEHPARGCDTGLPGDCKERGWRGGELTGGRGRTLWVFGAGRVAGFQGAWTPNYVKPLACALSALMRLTRRNEVVDHEA